MSNYVCCYCGEEIQDAASANFYHYEGGPENTDIVCDDCLADYEEAMQILITIQEAEDYL